MGLVSVIVPVYQVEQYLDRCIESIVNQTYRNIEIILVDDGSIDGCPSMCDQWSERDDRIKVIHKENGGLSDARNAGMGIATGQYIGFVDSDDWIAPEMYERLVTALKSDESDIAACAVKMVWDNNTPERLLTVSECCVLDRDQAQAELLAERRLKQPVWYKLYRREVIHGILFETQKYHEDVFWSYQVVGNALKVSMIDYIGYFYQQRISSIMGERYSLRRLDAIEAYCKRYKYMKERFPLLQGKALTAIWMGCIFHGQMALKYLPKEERKVAFDQLRTVQKEYPLSKADYESMKKTHRLWLWGSKYALRTVCRVKNSLGVGL